jgi:outer membrane protein assembly factor BamE (lipoprotein component of BamABCDE complex)
LGGCDNRFEPDELSNDRASTGRTAASTEMNLPSGRNGDIRAGVSLLILSVLSSLGFATVPVARPQTSRPVETAASDFNSWRPYKNSNQLVSVGMNKGQVIAMAGNPDYEDSYYQSYGPRLLRVSNWYYVRSDHDPETTLLKFVQEELVSIESTPSH